MDSRELNDLLAEHTDAWNSHDLDRLMALFADDCVFEAAGGDEACGTTYTGREAVRAAFADIFAAFPTPGGPKAVMGCSVPTTGCPSG